MNATVQCKREVRDQLNQENMPCNDHGPPTMSAHKLHCKLLFKGKENSIFQITIFTLIHPGPKDDKLSTFVLVLFCRSSGHSFEV